MNILIVAATRKEIEPVLKQMDSIKEIESESVIECEYKKLFITFKIGGIGIASTSMSTTAMLVDYIIDVALNVGVCGSFNKNLEIGTVVNVFEDCFSELGAEDGDDFLSIEEMELDAETKFESSLLPFKNKVISLLPKVNGITVNTVHGNEESIDKIVKRYHPIVESMEGAAFMMVSTHYNKPDAQIRAVSNYVERRNKDAWNIPLAIENLNKKVLEILDAF